MFVQITELGPEGERDWLVQGESLSEAYDKLIVLMRQQWLDETIVLKLIGAIPDEEVASIMESKNSEQFAFVCINS